MLDGRPGGNMDGDASHPVVSSWPERHACEDFEHMDSLGVATSELEQWAPRELASGEAAPPRACTPQAGDIGMQPGRPRCCMHGGRAGSAVKCAQGALHRVGVCMRVCDKDKRGEAGSTAKGASMPRMNPGTHTELITRPENDVAPTTSDRHKPTLTPTHAHTHACECATRTQAGRQAALAPLAEFS